ncbi:unnamed protein product, partial [Rotaria socialis]
SLSCFVASVVMTDDDADADASGGAAR